MIPPLALRSKASLLAKYASPLTELLHAIADTMRTDLPINEGLLLGLQLAAWRRLSQKDLVPSDLKLNSHRPVESVGDLEILFSRLEKLDIPNSGAFKRYGLARTTVGSGQLSHAIGMVSTADLNEPTSVQTIVELCSPVLRNEPRNWALPMEIGALMSTLACITEHDSVYCSFDDLLVLCSYALETTPTVCVESPNASPLPYLVNILCDQDISVSQADPISSSAYLHLERQKKFDKCISFPPLGAKRLTADIPRDGRFPQFFSNSVSLGVVATQDLLTKAKNSIVIGAPASLLFSPGTEKNLREHLISNRLVETIIELPSSLIPGIDIPLCIVVINLEKRAEDILFVDASRGDYLTRDGKGQSTLIHWEILAEDVKKRTSTSTCELVSISDLDRTEYKLQVSRYCLPLKQRALESALQGKLTYALKDLVMFSRPNAPVNIGGVLDVLEVGPADFRKFGFTESPGRQVQLSAHSVSRGPHQFLQPLDILIAIKGSVGKVAIVSDIVTKDDIRWVAGQSCLILRVMPKGIDSRALYMYLTSQAGQASLQRIVSGATVPMIQVRELERVRVPDDVLVDSYKLIEAFDQIVEYEKKISVLRQKQEFLARTYWTLLE